MKVVKDNSVKERNPVKPEDPLKKISGNLQSLKDIIESGIKQNKNENIIINQIANKLAAIFEGQIIALKTGMTDIGKSLKEMKMPDIPAPAKTFKVKNIDRDVNDNLRSFDIEVIR